MDAKYGDKARGGSLGLSLRLPRRRGSGTGTAVRRTICALLAFALLVYLPYRHRRSQDDMRAPGVRASGVPALT